MTEMRRTQRADAARNREAILDAALACLSIDPNSSMAAIAAQAGVGRVTLYGHFSSRADLVETLLTRALADSEGVLSNVDMTGTPWENLRGLVGSSWQLLHNFRVTLAAAESELSTETIRRHHGAPLRRVESILEEGMVAGDFRTDMSAAWLAALFHAVLHTAAGEVAAGRLLDFDAASLIWKTLDSVLSSGGTSSST